MTLLQYVDAHPWWAFAYLALIGLSAVSVAAILRTWTFVTHHHKSDYSKHESHSHNHNWPRATSAERVGDHFKVELPHPETCCRHRPIKGDTTKPRCGVHE